jgi:hypothetical protein
VRREQPISEQEAVARGLIRWEEVRFLPRMAPPTSSMTVRTRPRLCHQERQVRIHRIPKAADVS